MGARVNLLIEKSIPHPGDRYQKRNGRKLKTNTIYFI